jgi:menaquinol-cytochrome c reductase iron-sulfur subunit
MAEDRRTILKVLTGMIGTGAAAAVGLPAVRVLIAPMDKTTVSGAGTFVPVAREDAIPEDGAPLNVPVVIEAPRDAWTELPPTKVGAVFLRRVGGGIVAYSTICPHLGCGIDYVESTSRFACPCHESFFGLDGKVSSGPAPRPMDELETRIVDGQVEVKFEKFKIGTAEKAPA